MKRDDKKDIARFTIRFRINGFFPDSNHINAVNLLNAMPGGEIADFLAKAIAHYRKHLEERDSASDIHEVPKSTKRGRQPKKKPTNQLLTPSGVLTQPEEANPPEIPESTTSLPIATLVPTSPDQEPSTFVPISEVSEEKNVEGSALEKQSTIPPPEPQVLSGSEDEFEEMPEELLFAIQETMGGSKN